MTSNRDDDEPSFDIYGTLKKRLETTKTQKEMTQVRTKCEALFVSLLCECLGNQSTQEHVLRDIFVVTILLCYRSYR